jgi:hypothetical protein
MTPNEVRSLEKMNPIENGDTIYNPTLNNEAPDSIQADNLNDNAEASQAS